MDDATCILMWADITEVYSHPSWHEYDSKEGREERERAVERERVEERAGERKKEKELDGEMAFKISQEMLIDKKYIEDKEGEEMFGGHV